MPSLSLDTVSASSVLDLIDAAQCLSIVTDETLLPDRNLYLDPETRVCESVLVDLWQVLEKASSIDGYGLLIGQHINPASKGLLAGLVSQSANLKEAFDTFVKYLEWMGPSEHWSMVYDGEYVDLVFELDPAKHYPNAAIERSMSALISWANFLNGNSIPVERVSFALTKTDYDEVFYQVFEADIYFDAHHHSIRLKQSVLDNPIASHNPYVKLLLEDKMQKSVARIALAQKNDLSKERIRDLIVANLPEHKATVDVICQYLSISRQTLYRRLKKEGTDFKSLLNETRKIQSVKYLEQFDKSIQTISEQLGYNEISSFYTAFQRWYGMSVSQYRKNLKSHKNL